MRGPSLRLARWHNHANAVGAPSALRHWLTDTGSLTVKLSARSAAFRLQRLHQYAATCLADEAAAVGLARPGRVQEREVLLRCDNTPVVFGHSVVPVSATAADWPLFGALGERPLGTTVLFSDPLVARSDLQFARLQPSHPLAQRARRAWAGATQAELSEQAVLFARRRLYRRRHGLLLVTEVFFPSVLALAQAGHLIKNDE
ncbi:chorismate lyase [Massilia sp. MB5]|uniref:chorismate--pyruvate lyase family protein n=1 Tax=unclassified Massilia TaxID=2609279 RepID=UPI00067CB5D0|nr:MULTISPECIES: chorismate lyase [unclassified Massilia]AKU23897.1 chorismate--pyruvate lyase [Massilia sp. NR 4-1]UMR31150.1 chorismate lyase [Massilia sp. MB5]